MEESFVNEYSSSLMALVGKLNSDNIVDSYITAVNGAIYICKINKLMNEKRLLIRENIYAYKMSQQHSVDIDTNLDFILAKTILEEKNESTY